MDFEAIRIALNKRLKALQILSFVEALIVFFLSFTLTKDIIVSTFFAVLAGVLFYRILGKKLFWGRKELAFKICEEFLKQNHAKFDKNTFSGEEFKKISFDFSFKEFSSQNAFIFEDFTLYDVKIKDEFGNFFCGILLFSENLKPIDRKDDIFAKVQNKDFNTERIYSKDKYLLIASLKNPFFADLSIASEINFKIFRKNLQILREFLLTKQN